MEILVYNSCVMQAQNITQEPMFGPPNVINCGFRLGPEVCQSIRLMVDDSALEICIKVPQLPRVATKHVRLHHTVCLSGPQLKH